MYGDGGSMSALGRIEGCDREAFKLWNCEKKRIYVLGDEG